MSNKIGDLSLCDKHYGEYAHNYESVEWFEGLGVCQICLQNRIAELKSQLANEKRTSNQLLIAANNWQDRAEKAEAHLAKV